MMKSTAAILALLLAPASAWAAEPAAFLATSTGKVLVNQGQGYVALAPQSPLKAGDSILVGQNSTAVVAYEGCTIALDTPIVFAVPGAAPCTTGTLLPAPGDTISPAGFQFATPAVANMPLTGIVMGVAVAGVGTVIVVNAATAEQRHPVSAP